MMGLRPRQGNLGKPRIRLTNLKTSLRFPCLGLNPIIDSINLLRQIIQNIKGPEMAKKSKHAFLVL